MSASAVTRGNPCNRAARAPTNTKRTRCCASVVMRRSGSSGAALATPGPVHEAVDVADLVEALLGRQAQDARDVGEHVRAGGEAWGELRMEFEPGGGEQASEGIPARAGLAALDTGDDRLGGAGAAGELALRKARREARATQQGGWS